MAMAAAGFSAIGTIFGVVGGLQQAAAQKKEERARQQQMQLEVARRQRENLRQATVARATATSNAYSQGAGTTSALAGGLAQVTQASNRNSEAAGQDLFIGNQIFKARQQYADASGLISLGQGISSLGSVFGSNTDTLMRLSTT